MGVIVGFILGYLFGISNGPLDLNEIRAAWKEIKESQEVQAYLAGGVAMAGQALRQGATMLLNETGNRR